MEDEKKKPQTQPVLFRAVRQAGLQKRAVMKGRQSVSAPTDMTEAKASSQFSRCLGFMPTSSAGPNEWLSGKKGTAKSPVPCGEGGGCGLGGGQVYRYFRLKKHSAAADEKNLSRKCL